MIGTLNQYTEAVKEHKPVGQQQSLWEQFFTGVTEQFSGITQNAKDVYSYDISEAYSNYKKQQLQLEMNQRLGAGFKSQLGGELQTDYNRAFQDIRAEEASTIAEIGEEYESAVQTGVAQFEQMGEMAKRYDRLLQEYAKSAGVTQYEDMTKMYFDDEGNRVTELTDYGRLWYHDVLNKSYKDPLSGQTAYFEDWLANEDTVSEVSYKDRVALQKALQQNPELFANVVTGLTSDFDYEKTQTTYKSDMANRERVRKIKESESYFLTDKTINKNFSGAINSNEMKTNMNNALTNITNEYAADSVVSVSSFYDEQRQDHHSTVVVKYDKLSPAQQQAIRDSIGHHADSYLTNGEWKIHLSANGKIYPGQFGMSYSEFIRAMQQ